VGVGCDLGVGVGTAVGTGVGVGGSVGTGVGDGKWEEDERDVSEYASKVRPPPATTNPAIPIKTVRRETPCFGGTTDVGGGVSVVLGLGGVSMVSSESEAGGAETPPEIALLSDVEATGKVASTSSAWGA
jgi:hypothetical protein